MRIWSSITGFAVICLLATTGSPLAAAAAEVTPEKPPRALHCLRLNNIKDAKILDSRHILFTTVDHRIYLNTLPVRCPGMRPNDVYMYRTSLNELCDLDIITILQPAVLGFLPGASCGLGLFQPVTQEEVDALKAEIAGSRR